MKKEDIYMELFDCSRPTYYKRKREGNKALKLISKYFNDEDLEEFLKTGKINKLENIDMDLVNRIERLEEVLIKKIGGGR